MTFPSRRYAAILADPPWTFQARSEKGEGRSAKNHYPVMTLDDIKAVPVSTIAARNCVLFLWTTDTHMPQALDVMAAWGFTYKTVGFYWAKTTKDGSRYSVGMGYWTRANPEMCLLGTAGDDLCLLGTTGAPKRSDRTIERLVVAPRREHSRKPDEVRERIEQLVSGPYVELFARQKRPGWDAYGDETDRFPAIGDLL